MFLILPVFSGMLFLLINEIMSVLSLDLSQWQAGVVQPGSPSSEQHSSDSGWQNGGLISHFVAPSVWQLRPEAIPGVPWLGCSSLHKLCHAGLEVGRMTRKNRHYWHDVGLRNIPSRMNSRSRPRSILQWRRDVLCVCDILCMLEHGSLEKAYLPCNTEGWRRGQFQY